MLSVTIDEGTGACCPYYYIPCLCNKKCMASNKTVMHSLSPPSIEPDVVSWVRCSRPDGWVGSCLSVQTSCFLDCSQSSLTFYVHTCTISYLPHSHSQYLRSQTNHYFGDEKSWTLSLKNGIFCKLKKYKKRWRIAWLTIYRTSKKHQLYLNFCFIPFYTRFLYNLEMIGNCILDQCEITKACI